jgi:hypothetical protein
MHDGGGDEYEGDADWQQRRWQGEGRVVNRAFDRATNPARAPDAAVHIVRPAGDPQFGSGLGRHCQRCSRLDFLPQACASCGGVFCTECAPPAVHECTATPPGGGGRIIPDMTGWAEKGQRVQLHGLVASAEHNGKEAVVQHVALQRGERAHASSLVPHRLLLAPAVHVACAVIARHVRVQVPQATIAS